MKLKIAHIGAGYWGKNIVRNLHDLGVLEVICDIDANVLVEFKKHYPETRHIKDYEEALSESDIDAVTIATPAATHYGLVKAALHAGKDVFVEKPLSLTVEEGEELTRLAEKQQKILMVGHILRYHPAIEKIKEFIDRGELGRVGYCYSNRLNLGKVRREENILWSFAPHDISIFNYFFDGPPDEVNASGEVILQPNIHDITLTVLKWKNRGMAHIYVSWLHPFKEHRLVVVGDKAMLVFDDTRDTEKLILYKKGIDFVKGEPVKREDDSEAIAYKEHEPLRREMEHFIQCVTKRTQPRTNAREGLEVLRVLSLAETALQKPQRAEPRPEERDYFAHPTAVIDEGAEIGRDSKIWHFSHVMSKARLGERCSLGQNVYVANKVAIGNNVKIQNNVSVYEGVILEDDTFCGPSMVFTNVKNPRSAVPRNTADDYLKTLVRKGASLGANSTIVCGVTIGENAFVAAGAVVTKDVKPQALVAGIPAKQIGWMCLCGFKLEDKTDGLTCPECGKRYVLKNGDRLQSA